MTRVVAVFDRGWGQDVPLKQFEKLIVDRWLAKETASTVVINSTWYSQDYHQEVMSKLRSLAFDQIVVVSMLDAAIVRPEWYEEFGRPVKTLGYYPGQGFVDFWALVVDQHFQRPDYDCTDVNQIDTAYMCLNRKPHWHRQRLYQQLVDHAVVDQGLVSLGGNNTPAIKTLDLDQGHCNLAPNSGTEQNGINNDIMSLGHPANWCRHFLNIVTETEFDIQRTYFVSEKIYKPVLGLRPFLVYATDGAVSWLSERGFEPYTCDFADITDLDLAHPQNTAPFLQQLCQQSPSYWRSKYLALKEKILYNNANFYNYIKGMPCQI